MPSGIPRSCVPVMVSAVSASVFKSTAEFVERMYCGFASDEYAIDPEVPRAATPTTAAIL